MLSPEDTKAKAIGYNSYASYLFRSFYWHNFTERMLRSSCSGCHQGPRWKLKLFHLFLDRLGDELPEDVCSLCQFCYTDAHDAVKEGSLKREDALFYLRQKHLNAQAQMAFNFDAACNAAGYTLFSELELDEAA